MTTHGLYEFLTFFEQSTFYGPDRSAGSVWSKALFRIRAIFGILICAPAFVVMGIGVFFMMHLDLLTCCCCCQGPLKFLFIQVYMFPLEHIIGMVRDERGGFGCGRHACRWCYDEFGDRYPKRSYSDPSSSVG